MWRPHAHSDDPLAKSRSQSKICKVALTVGAPTLQRMPGRDVVLKGSMSWATGCSWAAHLGDFLWRGENWRITQPLDEQKNNILPDQVGVIQKISPNKKYFLSQPILKSHQTSAIQWFSIYALWHFSGPQRFSRYVMGVKRTVVENHPKTLLWLWF